MKNFILFISLFVLVLTCAAEQHDGSAQRILNFQNIVLYQNLLEDKGLDLRIKKEVERSLYALMFQYWVLAHKVTPGIPKDGGYEILGSGMLANLDRNNLKIDDPLEILDAEGKFAIDKDAFLSTTFLPLIGDEASYKRLVVEYGKFWIIGAGQLLEEELNKR